MKLTTQEANRYLITNFDISLLEYPWISIDVPTECLYMPQHCKDVLLSMRRKFICFPFVVGNAYIYCSLDHIPYNGLFI